MTDLELNRRLSNDPSTAGQGPENRDGTAGSSYLTADPVVDDVLPAISLVLMLLGEIARHGECLNRLEPNSRQREALARRRAEGTLPRKPPTGRPVGRPIKIKPDGLEAPPLA